MSHLELAAILRAKAWRNYPGVFTAPETRQERTARVVVKVLDGPTGGDTLTKTTFVQRLNTRGALAPSTGCASPSNVGNQAFVPYTADYFFYAAE